MSQVGYVINCQERSVVVEPTPGGELGVAMLVSLMNMSHGGEAKVLELASLELLANAMDCMFSEIME